MSVIYDLENKLFSLHTKDSTYQMKVSEQGFLLHTYYGKRIDAMDLSYLIQQQDRGFSGNPYDVGYDRSFSTDTIPQEYPVFGMGDYRESCLEVVAANGANAVDLRYVRHRIYNGKERLHGLPAAYANPDEVVSLDILLKDSATNIEVMLSYSVFEPYDAITRSVKIMNNGDSDVRLQRALSCCLDFCVPRKLSMISFYGKYCGERMPERRELSHGKLRIDSVRGSSSHHQNPFVILCDTYASETAGECFGACLVYSGNFLMQAEVDQIEQVRFVAGINPQGFSWHLKPGDSFQTPEVILCYGASGMEKITHHYHVLIREHICRGIYKNRRRPVLINNWEATYFDFDENKLLQIAAQAKELGIELFVLDDGWFGKRNDDTTSLGDWYPNTDKIGAGLDELAHKVRSLGLLFGIWIEPEMVSEDSELYRTHPDWCIHIPERAPVRSRHQLVLDLSRKDVTNHIYETVSSLLKNAEISYVKWDMNRHLANVYSLLLPEDRQGEVCHRYILGLYEVLERLVAEFPHVLFESCSGGGGRFDAGMLYYTPQIWTSDNTDAMDRIKIQYGTSFCYPLSVTCNHVSASPNHQTGRSYNMRVRGVVAMPGVLGYELDTAKLTEDEKSEIKNQIAIYKRVAEKITSGIYYRLTCPMVESRYAAWMIASQDKKSALIGFVLLKAEANASEICVRLRGLLPEATYVNNMNDLQLTGECLMNAGMVMPVLHGDLPSLCIMLETMN